MSDYIFVSYSSKDDKRVRKLIDHLESAGVKCWISCRDIDPGDDWAETIYDGIANSAGMILFFSSNVNRSRQIRNELDIATNLGITILPVKLEDIPVSKGVRYFTNSHQWLNAVDGSREAMDRLLESAARLLGREVSILPAEGLSEDKPAKSFRVWLFPVIIVAVIVIAALYIFRSDAAAATDGLLNMVAGGSDSWDYGTDIIAAPDRGFTVTGVWDYGFWSIWWITRFDSTGRPEWTWSDSLAGEDRPLLLPAAGGDVICATGEYADFEHTGFPVRAVRLDSEGGTVWENRWWLEWEGAVQPELGSFRMTSDSLLLLYFTLRQLNLGQIRANHQVILTSSGEFVRRDTLEGNRDARELLVLRSGSILRVSRDIGSGGNSIQIVSPNGNELDRAVIGDSRSFITCGVELPDGDLVMLMAKDTYGPGKGDLSVMRFSPELDLKWERVYGGSMPDVAADIQLLPSGDMIISGYTSSRGDGSADGWLLRLDRDGRIVWESVVDMGGDDYLGSISVLGEDGIFACGNTTMFGQPDVWILEVNREGEWNRLFRTGSDLLTEDWGKGFIDQTVWEVGYNRNYSPALHRDSVTESYSLDANGVPVLSLAEYPLMPGLSLSAEVTVPSMTGRQGNNWVAVGMTRSSADHFHLDPGTVSDLEMKWVYTPGINQQTRELRAICALDSGAGSFAAPETLLLERGVPQRLTIETCTETVRFWVNDSLLHEEPAAFCPEPDSVRIYVWGNSGSLPHHVENLRLFQRRW